MSTDTLKGKVAIVTGGSRGIGRAIVLKLAACGADVAFSGRSLNDNTASLEEEVAALGQRAKGYAADAGDYEASQAFVQQVLEDFGKVDILVNNAGITRDNLLIRMSEEEWDAVLKSNLKSVFNITKAVVPSMMRARSGSIINIASVVGRYGNAGQANYSASKAGMIAFTKSIAQEFGSRGIRANAIAPGFISTDMTADLSEEVLKSWTAAIPLKRAGTPEDIAKVVAFFASDDSAYITGQVLNVCGGMKM